MTDLSSQALCQAITQVLDDNKGENIVDLDVSQLTSLTDYLVIASGRSSRHVKALADHVVDSAKHQWHCANPRVQGEEYCEWILVDLGDVVVHVMQPQIREFYQLEKLWQVMK